jgi:chromosome segregation ATPase
VRGLLADFIDTDRAHAPLVEAALGPNLELLLIERADDAQRVRKALREVSGRVRLIAAEPVEAGDAGGGGNAAPPGSRSARPPATPCEGS